MLQSAIFIDAENIYRILSERSPLSASRFEKNPGRLISEIEKIEEGMPANFKFRRIVSKKYYAPPQFLAGKTNIVVKSGIEIVSSINPTGNNKNSADLKIAVDCLQMMHSNPNIQEYIILSDDTDLCHLTVELRKMGKNVILFSQNSQTKPHSRFADHLLRVSNLEKFLNVSQIADVKSEKVKLENNPVLSPSSLLEAVAEKPVQSSELDRALAFLAPHADVRQGFLPFPHALRLLIDGFPEVKEGNLFGFSDISSFSAALAAARPSSVRTDPDAGGIRILNERLDLSEWGYGPESQFVRFARVLLVEIDEPIPFLSPTEWQKLFQCMERLSHENYDQEEGYSEFVAALEDALFKNGIYLSSDEIWSVVDAVTAEGCYIESGTPAADYAHAWRVAIWEQCGRLPWLENEQGLMFLITWFCTENENVKKASENFLAAINEYAAKP